MKPICTKAAVFLLLSLMWVQNTTALTCKISEEPIDQFLKSEYRWADIVVVGTVVAWEQFGPGDFQVEGIWKGPDLEYLQVGLIADEGTRTVVFAKHGGSRDNDYINHGYWCNPWYRRIGHDGVVAKTIEIFGKPKPPDTSTPNLVFRMGVAVLLLALVGLSFGATKLVSLNKSLKADAQKGAA